MLLLAGPWEEEGVGVSLCSLRFFDGRQKGRKGHWPLMLLAELRNILPVCAVPMVCHAVVYSRGSHLLPEGYSYMLPAWACAISADCTY